MKDKNGEGVAQGEPQTIRLVGGPYEGREIEDSGAVEIRMGLSYGGETVGAEIGEAVYEPGEDRGVAFWKGNEWRGTLEGVVRCWP